MLEDREWIFVAVDADHLRMCLQTLNLIRYAMEIGWLPVRIELEGPGDRWVDVHPVRFDESGHGRQAGLDGEHFDYPPGAFTAETLNRRRINCLSVQQQRDFHAGYQHQAKDTQDLAELYAPDTLRRPANS